MKRYYICEIVGSGSGPEDPQRPRVVDFFVRFRDEDPKPVYEDEYLAGQVRWNYVLRTDPTTGKPYHTWTVVALEAPTQLAVRLDPGVRMLPDWPIGGTIGGLSAVDRAAFNDILTRFRINLGTIPTSRRWGGVIEDMLRQHEAHVLIDEFDAVVRG